MGAASITMNEGAAARPAINPPAVNPWIIAIAVTLDHRQFQLALDFLRQHPGWNSFPAVDVAFDSGPARIPAPQVERNSH